MNVSYASSSLQLGDQLQWKDSQQRRDSTADASTKHDSDSSKRQSSGVPSMPLSFAPSPVSSPITVSSSRTNDDFEERLQHLDAVNKIRSKRESARLKYQRILINRSSASRTTSASKATSGTVTTSTESATTKKSKRKKLKKPLVIQRDCSEIDDRDGDDDDTVLETDTVCSPRVEDDYFSSMRPSTAPPMPLSSSIHGAFFGDTSLGGFQAKPKPHIKRYAEEYNTLVGTVVDLVSKRGESKPHQITDYTIKSGQLSKVATMVVGIGFDTFIELKEGIFRYYEDVGNGNVKIRTIPLYRHSTKCRATKHMESQPFAGWSRVFELIMDNGGPRLYWMAKSEDERNEWIDAINQAMVEDEPESFADADTNSPVYNADIVLYLHIQGLLRGATLKDDYLGAISLMAGKTLSIPVNWLKQYSEVDQTSAEIQEDGLWQELFKGSIKINGQTIRGAYYERAITALTSHIIDIDSYSTMLKPSRVRIKDSQAVSYARDILLSCSRETREDDNHSLFCVNTLISSHLAMISRSPSDAEPLQINIRRISSRRDRDRNEDDYSIRRTNSNESLFSTRSEMSHRSLDLSCCDSVQDSVVADSPGANIEVSIKVSNIYRICARGRGRYDEDTWG